MLRSPFEIVISSRFTISWSSYESSSGFSLGSVLATGIARLSLFILFDALQDLLKVLKRLDVTGRPIVDIFPFP